MSGKESFSDRSVPDEDLALGKPLWQRLGWLVIIWTGSVLALFVVAMLLRMFMTAAGMKSH
ncbi:DUF2474 domain-containing protein [Pseudomonas sp. LP_7_YM]|uniref:DUF2474 domain-containing protein n=1 Tax=Pseudomonas sp. LP_7_YM TaxID=2485137 RepID=UPI00105C290F|nr:DUF2474 domain-containing protein [Pseudomonas sp. LP_7_YM]TDV60355.1 uncharacterized protein DUF2474 [Pseudomonas sp. LP_7_YM]